MFLRAIFRHSARLENLTTYAYARFDGQASEGRSKQYRRFWEVVGDQADNLRCLIIQRPVLEHQRQERRAR